MSTHSFQRALPAMEVQRVDGPRQPDDDAVRSVDRVAVIPLAIAKVEAGAALREAIGTKPFKQFGDESLIGKICTGEKMPDYFGRVVQDPVVCRRFALALLRRDKKVVLTKTLTLTLPEDM